MLGGLLGTISIIGLISSAALFTLARLKTSMLNFFMLQDMHEGDTGHVSIVGGLVIVRQWTLALVVDKLVKNVVLAAQVVLEFVVFGALIVNLAKCCLIKGF